MWIRFWGKNNSNQIIASIELRVSMFSCFLSYVFHEIQYNDKYNLRFVSNYGECQFMGVKWCEGIDLMIGGGSHKESAKLVISCKL